MNCVSIFPTQCHTAGRWQVNQNVGAHINGLVFFYFLLCVCVLTRALFLFYLYFLEKNYYKHSVFYRAKTITKINGRNLTAICLANVSVRDCFLRLSIYCIPSSSSSSSFFLFLFLISVSWCCVRSTLSSLLSDLVHFYFFSAYWAFWCICVCAMCDARCFNLIDGILAVCSQSKFSKYFILLFNTVDFFNHSLSVVCLYECTHFFRINLGRPKPVSLISSIFPLYLRNVLTGLTIGWTLPLFI